MPLSSPSSSPGPNRITGRGKNQLSGFLLWRDGQGLGRPGQAEKQALGSLEVGIPRWDAWVGWGNRPAAGAGGSSARCLSLSIKKVTAASYLQLLKGNKAVCL